jgi:hypothetical protein
VELAGYCQESLRDSDAAATFDGTVLLERGCSIFASIVFIGLAPA